MSTGYLLPFPKGTKVWCTQGNNNPAPGASHKPGSKAAFAFDFSLAPGDADEGELLIAATGGVVAGIREDTPDHVTGSAGRGRGNYLLIAHGDSTCDIYMHLKHGSVSEFGLAVGSQVVRGQPIARLGKTGFCFGAHLHFQRQSCNGCSIPCNQNYFQPSVPISFDDVPGDGIPKAGVAYFSNNELGGGEPIALEDALEEVTSQRQQAMLLPARVFRSVAHQANLGAPLSGVTQMTSPSGHVYAIQVFEGDTLSIRATPPIDEAGVSRMGSALAANPNDIWALMLWGHTYSNMGLTFQSRWASHLFALDQVGTNPLGSPLGGGLTNGVHTIFLDGNRYEAEVYAKDTIYWVAGVWGEIHRMSELHQAGALQSWLFSISADREAAVVQPARALSDFAQQHNLGAPLSGITALTGPDSRPYYVQVFELDTLYLHTEAAPSVPNVGSMSTLLIADRHEAWGVELWEHTYANAGLTYHPHWASHQFVFGQLGTRPLGAPLGGGSSNGVFTRFIDGTKHEMEVYARDTIYWIPPNWATILRMSDL
jgi:hypothetical protein